MPSAMLELDEKKQKLVRHVARINCYFSNIFVRIIRGEVISIFIANVCKSLTD